MNALNRTLLNQLTAHQELPTLVIGAGPVGLAAAAHLVARGHRPIVLEAGARIGANMRAWGHVRMFSPWKYNIDAAARSLLAGAGWTPPADEEAFPTGNELVDAYLERAESSDNQSRVVFLQSLAEKAIARLAWVRSLATA